MPRQSEYTQEQVNEALDDYINPGECDGGSLLRDLDPAMVREYLSNNLNSGDDDFLMPRAMEATRFYLLRDLVDTLIGLLNEDPQTHEELEATCSLIAAICELGTSAQQKQAQEVFEKLVSADAVEASESLQLLVDTFFDLPPKAPPKALSDRVAALHAKCKRSKSQEELWRYAQIERQYFPWVRKEKSRKDWLLERSENEEGNQAWAQAYLIYDMKTPFKWDTQGGYALIRIARDQGDEVAVAALTAAMVRIDPEKDTGDAVKFRKTRGYRAREYFLEKLTGPLKRDRDTWLIAQDDLIQ